MSLYAAGIVTMAIVLLPSVDRLTDRSFAAHMTQHLVMICVAAPCLALGSPIVALLWALPRRWRHRVGHAIGTTLRIVSIPAWAWSLHALALAFWHVPRAYAWATSSEPIHAVEHGSFVLTACLFWWVVLPSRPGRRLGYGASVLSVTALGVFMGIYGAVLTFAPVPWYGFSVGDQQLAGVIMWIPTGVIYLGAALWCFAEWMKSDQPIDAPPLTPS